MSDNILPENEIVDAKSNPIYSESVNLEDINPGERLRDYLKEIFPLQAESKASFVDRIDEGIKAEGELTKLVYESTVNYLLRRLINTAEFLRRRYETDEYPESFFIDELRKFLREELRLNSTEVEKIFSMLLVCLSIKKQSRKHKKKRILKQYLQANNELLCYICGRALVEEEAQIEHLWPKAMGGLERELNLKIACPQCNCEKWNYIDSSDFHYEEICLIGDEEANDESFQKEFKRVYKIASWSKNNYKCILCDLPTNQVGKLKLVRKNLNDSWHFLNVDAICEKCLGSGR